MLEKAISTLGSLEIRSGMDTVYYKMIYMTEVVRPQLNHSEHG